MQGSPEAVIPTLCMVDTPRGKGDAALHGGVLLATLERVPAQSPICLAMIIFITSFVPAKMRLTRASA